MTFSTSALDLVVIPTSVEDSELANPLPVPAMVASSDSGDIEEVLDGVELVSGEMGTGNAIMVEFDVGEAGDVVLVVGEANVASEVVSGGDFSEGSADFTVPSVTLVVEENEAEVLE